MSDPNSFNFLLFFGRFHPLIVHLPIGFLTLLAVVELAGRTRRFHNVGHSRGVILILTVAAAIVSVTFGLMLSSEGGYDSNLLFWHKWLGIGLTVACLLTGLAYWRKKHLLYSGLLMVTLAIMGPASHFGGSMTHGKDWLTVFAPQWFRSMLGEKPAPEVAQPKKITDPQQAVVFADLVQPILQQDCISCHSADKSKGNLRLDVLGNVLKGGDSGHTVVAGKSADSVMIQRMLLPETDPKHMPPAGKPQPTDDQLTLIQWWIDSGATSDKKVADLNPPAKVLNALDEIFGPPTSPAPSGSNSLAGSPATAEPKPLADLDPVIAQLQTDLHIVIAPLAADQPWLDCNAGIRRSFGDSDLAKLSVIANNIQSLDLAGTKVTDAGMTTVENMHNLARLHLERTAVTDAGLQHVSKLRKLQYINLYGTPITDAGINSLKGLPDLHHLFLWQTQVTPDAAKAFADAMIDKQKIERWQKDIEALQARIRSQNIEVVQSTQQTIIPAATTPMAPAPGKPAVAVPAGTSALATAAPINTICPITGLPIDPTKTVVYKGKTIAFCCSDCLAQFKKNPKAVLAKLKLASTAVTPK